MFSKVLILSISFPVISTEVINLGQFYLGNRLIETLFLGKKRKHFDEWVESINKSIVGESMTKIQWFIAMGGRKWLRRNNYG